MDLHTRKSAFILSLSTLALGATASAQDVPIPPIEPPPNANAQPLSNPMVLFGPQPSASVGAGIGRIGDSWYFQLDPFVQFDLGKVAIAAQVPLDLLLPLPKPATADKASAYGGVVRREDFPPLTLNTYGHYLAMIRMIRFGEQTDPLYVQYGQFYGHTLGHGTIMDHYSNVLDPTDSKPGFAFALNSKNWGGIEVFTNDIAWPSTEILATRAYIRPLGIAKVGGDFAKKWAIGFTYVEDRRAPGFASQTAAENFNPETSGVTPTHPAAVGGIDTELQIIDLPFLGLTPYVDLNDQVTSMTTWGLHVGVLGRLAFPVFGAFRIWARLEYRAMQPGYIPDYFDSLYDEQRSAYPVNDSTLLDKVNAATFLAPHGPKGITALVHGIYGEATADVLHIVQAGGTFRATPGVPDSGNLMLFATLPKLGPVKVSAYYLHNNFDAAKQLVELDSNTSIAGVVMFNVWGPFWLMADVTRSYVANDHSDGTVTYTPETTEQFGFTTYFPF